MYFLNSFALCYLAVALIEGAREYLEALALVADDTAEDALDTRLDVAGGGREARGDLTESNIFSCFPAQCQTTTDCFQMTSEINSL